MFAEVQKLPDVTNDLIRATLAKFNGLASWTTEKKRLRAQLQRLLVRHGYVTFSGKWDRYNLQRIGQSCQYDVPSTRRGHLRPFRGSRVRLVCVGYERHDRILMAGVVFSEALRPKVMTAQ